MGDFPQSLGPFATQKATGLHEFLCLKTEEEAEQADAERADETTVPANPTFVRYVVTDGISEKYLAKGLKDKIDSNQIERYGQISPISDITLDAKTRELISIPVEADCFAWAYPLEGMTDDHVVSLPKVQDGESEAARSLFLFGGFIYIQRATGKVLCVNAIMPGQGLGFDGPFPWPVRNTDPDRFSQITFPGLIEAGAKYFAWIAPGECINSHAPISANGAFAYLFGDDKDVDDPRNCYFVVKEDTVLDVTVTEPILRATLEDGKVDVSRYGQGKAVNLKTLLSHIQNRKCTLAVNADKSVVRKCKHLRIHIRDCDRLLVEMLRKQYDGGVGGGVGGGGGDETWSIKGVHRSAIRHSFNSTQSWEAAAADALHKYLNKSFKPPYTQAQRLFRQDSRVSDLPRPQD
jgi:hypothetical protein